MLTRRLLPALLAAPALAQAQPSPFRRPVRIVVSSAAGASLDTLARVLAPAVSARIGQPVVVENQGGANGLIATQQVARSEPDGTTLLVTGDAIVLSEIANPQPGLGFREAFAPVVQAVKAAQILVTRPSSGFRDVQGYIAAVKAQPGKLNVGIPALGGIAQVVHEVLAKRGGGLPVEYVFYRGGGPATLDLLARNTDALVITLPAITDQVRQGSIIPLAVTTGERDPALPEVPTLAETVAPGFDIDSWQGVLAPARTPPTTLAALNTIFTEALRDPAVSERLTGLGFAVTALPPDQFAARAAASIETFGPVVRALANTGPRS
jgi:tripartite-type tricarboxylate transporter receptor subunit TctC